MSNQQLIQYKALYLQTAKDYLVSLQKNVDILIQDPQNQAALEQTHIDSHSLKSQSLLMQYNNIGSLCEAIEKACVEVIDKKKTFTNDILQIIKIGVQKMLDSLVEIEKEDKDVDLSKEINQINNFQNKG